MTLEPVVLFLLALAMAAGMLLAASWWGVRGLRQSRPPVSRRDHIADAPDGTQRVALVLNPVKLRAQAARRRVEELCARAGWDPPMVLETTVTDPGTGQARKALRDGADVVIAAGGDGTVRAVAQALTHTGTPLGLLPLGTGNLLARNLGLRPADLAENARTALLGGQRRIDVVQVRLENPHTGGESPELCLVMGGIGLDAQVVAATRDDLKRRVGWLAYSEAGMRHLIGRRQRVSISLDGEEPQNRKVRSVLFANCGKLPGGIEFIPDSYLDDGYLDVVVISPRSVLGWLWMTITVVLRQRRPIPVINYYRARTVTVTAAEPTATQLDGDLSGAVTTLSAHVDPGALLVRVNQDPGPATLR
jgi:diacylglycerol kinase (ATP)